MSAPMKRINVDSVATSILFRRTNVNSTATYPSQFYCDVPKPVIFRRTKVNSVATYQRVNSVAKYQSQFYCDVPKSQFCCEVPKSILLRRTKKSILLRGTKVSSIAMSQCQRLYYGTQFDVPMSTLQKRFSINSTATIYCYISVSSLLLNTDVSSIAKLY